MATAHRGSSRLRTPLTCPTGAHSLERPFGSPQPLQLQRWPLCCAPWHHPASDRTLTSHLLSPRATHMPRPPPAHCTEPGTVPAGHKRALRMLCGLCNKKQAPRSIQGVRPAPFLRAAGCLGAKAALPAPALPSRPTNFPMLDTDGNSAASWHAPPWQPNQKQPENAQVCSSSSSSVCHQEPGTVSSDPGSSGAAQAGGAGRGQLEEGTCG